jgi:hypothetical protein
MKAGINACVICDDNGWEVPTSTGLVYCAHDSGFGTLECMSPQCMCTRSRVAALGTVFGLWIGKDRDTPMAHLMLRFKVLLQLPSEAVLIFLQMRYCLVFSIPLDNWLVPM